MFDSQSADRHNNQGKQVRKNTCETFGIRKLCFCQIFNRGVFGWFA